MTKAEIKKLLDKHGIEPKKSLGQNFLIDQNIITKIANLSKLEEKDFVLEIGPGLGGLTRVLIQRADQVIAVEKDNKLTKILKDLFSGCSRLRIVNQDILLAKDLILELEDYKIVANLPYYLTVRVIRKFLEVQNQPQEMILLIQKEVAQRICAQPPKTNLLAVSVQYYSQPKILGYISKNCFWPKPKVDSAIIRISGLKKRNCDDSKDFFKFVKAGFSFPRKQAANNLSKQLGVNKQEIETALVEIGFSQQARAENLSFQDWEKLIGKLK